jgi:hypothetical protein
MAAKTVTPNAMKKLLAKARSCGPTGRTVEVGGNGYYLVAAGVVQM